MVEGKKCGRWRGWWGRKKAAYVRTFIATYITYVCIEIYRVRGIARGKKDERGRGKKEKNRKRMYGEEWEREREKEKRKKKRGRPKRAVVGRQRWRGGKGLCAVRWRWPPPPPADGRSARGPRRYRRSRRRAAARRFVGPTGIRRAPSVRQSSLIVRAVSTRVCCSVVVVVCSCSHMCRASADHIVRRRRRLSTHADSKS